MAFKIWEEEAEDVMETLTALEIRINLRKIPWKEEPGKLQSMGSQRVGYD